MSSVLCSSLQEGFRNTFNEDEASQVAFSFYSPPVRLAWMTGYMVICPEKYSTLVSLWSVVGKATSITEKERLFP